jgi:hypothetical protein
VKLDPTKNQFKMDQRSEVLGTLKLVQENKDTGTGNNFLNRTLISQDIKELANGIASN